MKLKKRPSIREKRRYIFFKVHSEMGIDYENIKNAVWDSLSEWMGTNDLSKANVKFVKNLWNRKKQFGVISVSHRLVDHVKVGLGLVHQIGDSRVLFQTLLVSGTIKSGMKKLGRV